MNVLEMINALQHQARTAGGKLTDLALPVPLFDAFLKQLIEEGALPENYKPGDKLEYNGTVIHTGEND